MSGTGLLFGNPKQLLIQLGAALTVIFWDALVTFLLLKLIGLVVPLRMSEADMQEGDLAVHGHEVYPSDVPSLSFPSGGTAWTPAGTTAEAPTS